MITVTVAGGFDPLHVGHLEHFREAKKLGDRPIVIIGPDEFLIKKKGFVFMPLVDRIEILQELRIVNGVVVAIDKDGTVAKTIRMIKPQIFAKGGDRTADNMPEGELKVCEEIGCKIVFGVGRQLRSSTEMAIDLVLSVREGLPEDE